VRDSWNKRFVSLASEFLVLVSWVLLVKGYGGDFIELYGVCIVIRAI
jgi:hypothetical protein